MASKTGNKCETSNSLLVCQNLSFAYQNKVILHNISFSIKNNEFLGLIGSNGAGKSTLLRCLYRYLIPTCGELLFNEQPFEQIDTRLFSQHVAVVVQELPNDFNLNVFDVVSLGLVPYQQFFSKLSSCQKESVYKALDAVGLSEKCKQGYETLSGGEKQRVLIAKAIVQKPTLLIMDEPTSHLDIKYQLEIMQLAKSLGIAVIASFHDLNLASAMSDRLLLLHNGHLVSEGEPEQVVSSKNLQQYFGVDAIIGKHPTDDFPLVTYHYSKAET